MARTVREEDYAVRRNEILDAAQKLIYTKGYEQMTIQGILDEARISKGAFYHYFDSKQDLLEALTERMMNEGEALLKPIVEDPELNALEKLQRYFVIGGRWKTAQKDYLLALMRVWYLDENAIVREKMFSEAIKRIGPLMARIFQQGLAEGLMTTRYPEQMSEVVMGMVEGLSELYARRLLSTTAGAEDLAEMRCVTDAYQDAMERVLGTPTGSLKLINDEMLEVWFSHEQEAA